MPTLPELTVPETRRRGFKMASRQPLGNASEIRVERTPSPSSGNSVEDWITELSGSGGPVFAATTGNSRVPIVRANANRNGARDSQSVEVISTTFSIVRHARSKFFLIASFGLGYIDTANHSADYRWQWRQASGSWTDLGDWIDNFYWHSSSGPEDNAFFTVSMGFDPPSDLDTTMDIQFRLIMRRTGGASGNSTSVEGRSLLGIEFSTGASGSSGSGGGLLEADVDARIRLLVQQFALDATTNILTNKIPDAFATDAEVAILINSRVPDVIPGLTSATRGFYLRQSASGESWELGELPSSGGGGLSQSEVDARIQALVNAFARDNTTDVPDPQIPDEITRDAELVARVPAVLPTPTEATRGQVLRQHGSDETMVFGLDANVSATPLFDDIVSSRLSTSNYNLGTLTANAADTYLLFTWAKGDLGVSGMVREREMRTRYTQDSLQLGILTPSNAFILRNPQLNLNAHFYTYGSTKQLAVSVSRGSRIQVTRIDLGYVAPQSSPTSDPQITRFDVWKPDNSLPQADVDPGTDIGVQTFHMHSELSSPPFGHAYTIEIINPDGTVSAHTTELETDTSLTGTWRRSNIVRIGTGTVLNNGESWTLRARAYDTDGNLTDEKMWSISAFPRFHFGYLTPEQDHTDIVFSESANNTDGPQTISITEGHIRAPYFVYPPDYPIPNRFLIDSVDYSRYLLRNTITLEGIIYNVVRFRPEHSMGHQASGLVIESGE